MPVLNENIKATTVPGYTIISNGTTMHDIALKSLRIEFEFATIPKAFILLSDGSVAKQNFELSGSNAWAVGSSVEIKIGYAQQHKTVFKGIIIKQGIRSSSGLSPFVSIELKHAYFQSTLLRNNGVFLNQKDSDILSDILNKYNFSAQVDSSNYEQEQMVQFNSSDWDFINLRAEANAMFVIPNNDQIMIKKINSVAAEKTELQFGSNILSVDLAVDTVNCFESYATKSWNASDQEIIDATASINAMDSIGQRSLNQMAGLHQDKKMELTAFGSINEYEMEQMANDALLRADLGKVFGTIKCEGTNDVLIGDWVKLSGLGNQFNGKALVTGILHELADGIWFTIIKVGIDATKYADRFSNIDTKPAAGLLPSLHGLQIGIVSKLVSDLNDEAILVSLPNLKSGEDAVWARCARIDAGKDRGFIFRPEIGDEVILGFINNDPRQAVILGSMHSAKNVAPADLAADDDNKFKGFVSRSEMKLVFDDEKKIIQIATPMASIVINDDDKSIKVKSENSEIVMSDDGIKMTSKKDINIKADGDVKIEGKDVKLSAQASFAAEGSGGAKVNTSGILELKGSMVNIN